MNMGIVAGATIMQGVGAGIAARTLGALGFGDPHLLTQTSFVLWKLANLTETLTRVLTARSPAASSCIRRAILERVRGRRSRISKATPIIRPIAARCARRAPRCSDFVHSKTRTLYPQIRKPGSDKFERVSWEAALDRVARLMKDDRDKNFIAKNNDGVTVNRWLDAPASWRHRRRPMKRRG